MTATRIDGKAVAESLRARVAAAVAQMGVKPGLAVVLVGEDPASQVYVRSKVKACEEAGIASFHHTLPAETGQADLLALLDRLNADAAVHGILVQLPLPGHIDEQTVIERIDPAKDVDGFHPVNVGRLSLGLPALEPCTPRGCMILAQSVRQDLTGLHAVIVGRSNIVGKPMAQMLLAANCTVTIAHSRTRDLPAVCREADVLVAAVGRPQMIRGDWIKPGAIVLDVGINRIPREDGSGKTRLVGDVAYAEAAEVAAAVTPVPGGVGPMTIACLLRNTVIAAARLASEAVPAALDA
ncbi:MAG: bifunctional methylenetetrahydrofolate dehydrogenase/methenyltetrahydrofolate cyclohydrolase FolD [Alphaproteobacteria bacterium]|nr:bifunctional methylenetetrahydrofolate dehydrogenase/methenyltetrahydrofolate cyclohydrolase FolD [Alphaproteobacteria bacterium]